MYRERASCSGNWSSSTSRSTATDRGVRGHGRFVDAHTVAVCGADGGCWLSLAGDVIVIATGSSPNRPADIPFDGETVFDSNTMLGCRGCRRR